VTFYSGNLCKQSKVQAAWLPPGRSETTPADIDRSSVPVGTVPTFIEAMVLQDRRLIDSDPLNTPFFSPKKTRLVSGLDRGQRWLTDCRLMSGNLSVTISLSLPGGLSKP